MDVLRYAVAKSPRIWDVAAGITIVRESGGAVKQVMEPNKLRKIILGQDGKFETFHKFETDPINQESNIKLLKNWCGTLVFERH